MFKVCARLDQIEELYVAENAPPALRVYAGANGRLQGRDGDFVISTIGIRDLGKANRPRVVEVYTLAQERWTAIAVPEYLARHAAEPINRILEGGDRSALRQTIDEFRAICAGLDAQLEGMASKSSPAAARASSAGTWVAAVLAAGALMLAYHAKNSVVKPDPALQELPAKLGDLERRVATLSANLVSSGVLESRIAALELAQKKRSSGEVEQNVSALERRVAVLESAARKSANSVTPTNQQTTAEGRTAVTTVTVHPGQNGPIVLLLPPGNFKQVRLEWTSRAVEMDASQLRWKFQGGDVAVESAEKDNGGFRLSVPRKSRFVGLGSEYPLSLVIDLIPSEKVPWDVRLVGLPE